MSAEDAWRNWERLLEPREEADRLEGPGQELDLDDTIAYGHDSDDDDDNGMAAADIAALLGQLTQANLDQAQREVDRDAQAVAAAAARVTRYALRWGA